MFDSFDMRTASHFTRSAFTPARFRVEERIVVIVSCAMLCLQQAMSLIGIRMGPGEWKRSGILAAAFLIFASAGQAEDKPLVVEAELLKKAPVPSLSDIAPYDEAVVLYLWEIEEVISGEMEAEQIGVFHWGYYDRKEQGIEHWRTGRTRRLTLSPWATRPELHTIQSVEPEGVDYAMPIFMDEGQAIRRGRTDRSDRFDYGGRSGVSDRMTDLLYIRHAVRMVGFGDSRAKAGIVPQLFYPDEIEQIPVAYNMAYDSTGIPSLYDLTHEYLVHLPQLESVLWNFSPRMLNRNWTGREIQIKGSPGNEYDRENADELWDNAEDAVVLRSAQIDWEAPPFGWEVRGTSATERAFPAEERARSYDFDEENWERLQRVAESLAEQDVHFIIFISPMGIHPSRGAVDTDGTPRPVHAENMERLRKLANRYATVHLYDIHQDGGHDFQREHFHDTDHLNQAGAEKLSRMLEAYRAHVVQHHHHLVEEYGDGQAVSSTELSQAVREADSALATFAVRRLRDTDEISAFPALLERYLSTPHDAEINSEEETLRWTLHETMVDMAPEVEYEHLSSLPELIRRDEDMKYPALVAVLAKAMADDESLKESFDDEVQSLMGDFVVRAFEAGDEELAAALPFAVADSIDLPLQRIQINFQTDDAPTPDGFIADYGKVKQEQGDYVFGWENDNTSEARYHAGDHEDLRYATMNHFRNGPWRMKITNGNYYLTVVTGDPANTGHKSHLMVNETPLSDTRPGEHFMHHEFKVTVSDGEIVIQPDEHARNAKIVYLIIEGLE
ncbi:MAG: hypothetical protein JJT75_01125 [Opitutales bacterium]|nr:hypothetical protein [Opitutales bacterium]